MSSKHILFLLVLFLFPFPIFASVAINEILPNPSGASTEESEFIELYNSGDSSVDLGGWKLDDETDGGSSPYTIASGTAIPAKSYLVFEKSQTNIALNNTGDIVQLIEGTSNVDSYTYPSAQNYEDVSFGRTSDGIGIMIIGTSDTAPVRRHSQ